MNARPSTPGRSAPPRPPTRGWSKKRRMLSLFRPASVWAAAMVVLTLSFSTPATALAQGSGSPNPATGNPLSPGLPQSQTPTPTAPATTTPATPTPSAPVVTNPSSSSSSGGGLNGTETVVIALGAIVVLGGISFFIWRDARRRAPMRHRTAAATAGAGGRSRSGSKPAPKPRKLSPAERRRRKRGRAR